MVENMQQVEMQKLQLVNSLNQAAESLRNAAAMAESFATVLHTTALSPSSSSLSHLNLFPNFANTGLPPQLQQQLQQQGHSAAASQFSQQLLQQLAQQNEAAGAHFQSQQVAKKDEPAPRKRKRGSAVEGDEKPGRKRRVKDPNAPKRPPSAYLLFQNQVRKEMVKQHDGLPYHEVLGEIAKRWAVMPDEQKRVYNEATSKAKVEYEASKAAYEQEKLAKEVADQSLVSPVVEASSPEEVDESDEDVSHVKPNGAEPVAHSPDNSDAEDGDDEEAEVAAAAASSASASPVLPTATIAPPKLSAVPAHLQTPAPKRTAVPFSSPAIESIKTMPTPVPEKKEKRKRERKEKKKE